MVGNSAAAAETFFFDGNGVVVLSGSLLFFAKTLLGIGGELVESLLLSLERDKSLDYSESLKLALSAFLN
jgi:hypothetical protein